MTRIGDVTPAQIVVAKWQQPRDPWTLWVDLAVTGYYSGCCVASFFQGVKASDRRRLSAHVSVMMNYDREQPPVGVWTRLPNHSLACDGIKTITVSSYLSRETREALLAAMCARLNGDNQ